MRLLADQDVWAATVRAMRDAGHDVVRSAESVGARAPDSEVLRAAERDGRILLTRDLDFGRLMLAWPPRPTGVIILRFGRRLTELVHAELLGVLASHSHEEIQGALVVVEAGRHRLRRLRSEPAEE